MTEQMTRLRQMLKEKKIEFVDRSDPEGSKIHIDRTHFIVEGQKTHFFSVIHGFATYGGISLYGKDYGLLEVQIDHKDPVGFKTAEDVMKMVEEIEDEKKQNTLD